MSSSGLDHLGRMGAPVTLHESLCTLLAPQGVASVRRFPSSGHL